MIIACPNCNTRYKIDPSRFQTPEITFRCKKCDRLLKIDSTPEPDFTAAANAVQVASDMAAKQEAEEISALSASPAVNETVEPAVSPPRQQVRRPHKILVADDELSICMLVEEILSGSDYYIITARDGLEAFEKVKTEKPDLVILDLLMPKMTGFEVLKEIRQIDKDLPVLVMTAIYKKASQVLVVKELGASGYLEKPFSPDHLLFRVANLLKDREQPMQ